MIFAKITLFVTFLFIIYEIFKLTNLTYFNFFYKKHHDNKDFEMENLSFAIITLIENFYTFIVLLLIIFTPTIIIQISFACLKILGFITTKMMKKRIDITNIILIDCILSIIILLFIVIQYYFYLS
jgi:hypothetical protein